jgi:hypothetical protein
VQGGESEKSVFFARYKRAKNTQKILFFSWLWRRLVGTQGFIDKTDFVGEIVEAPPFPRLQTSV